MIRHVLTKLGFLRSAFAVGVGVPFLIAASAFAQAPPVTSAAPVDPAAQAQATGGVATTERVIVTGSYIPTAETESALPVTVYTAEVLQKQGANTPIEGLRQLPSFVGNATTENDSNGGNGSAGINLRGIGQQNTLILINGRRAFLGQANNGSPDINAIPISALARSEVLKDGASAIYGSDAVAGVVNFVMINGPGEAPYEGAELFALYGNTTDSDAHVRQVYLRGGVATDKVAVAAAGEYYSRANLFSRDRTIATTGDKSNNPTGLGLAGQNTNSPTYAGRVNINAGGSSLGLVTGQRTLIDLTMGGTIVPADYRQFDAAGAGTDPDRFNFRAFTPAIPAQEMAKYYVTGRYKIFGEALQIYGDIFYAKVKQDNGLAAAPFAVGGAAAQASPYNPFGVALTSVSYRLVNDLGLRRSFFNHDYYRYTAGLNGDFNFKDNGFISHFGYDTGIVYERFDEVRIDSGDATFTAIAEEIAAGNFNPFIGQNAPLQGVAGTFGQGVGGAPVPTGMTQAYDNAAAAQRASYVGHSLFYEKDWLVDVKINAHLFPNLWNGGVDIAAGYEHREIRQHSVPDPVQAAGDQLGFNQAPLFKFNRRVDSYFAEINVPFVTSTMNVPFIRSLEFAFAYRFEKFKDQDAFKLQVPFENNRTEFDNGGTMRISGRYQPFADLTLRGTYSESFLSPTSNQQFQPVTQNFPVVADPLNNVTLQPPEGVWQGGNVNLQPENTTSWSAGVVYTPKWLPGFTITADWYQLYTTDLLLTAANNAQVLLTLNVPDPDGYGNGSGTIDGPGGPGDGVTRFDDGTLEAIDADAANAGKRHVQGLDVTAVYEIPTQNLGTFTFSGGWNHFFTWKAQPGVGPFANFLGDFSATLPLTPGSIPFNKAFMRGEWYWRGLDFIATVNYIGDYEDDPSFLTTAGPPIGRGQSQIPTPIGTLPEFVLHRRVSDYWTLDLQLSYEFIKPDIQPVAAGYSKDAKDAKSVSSDVAGADTSTIWQRMLWGTKITVGCNNVFDRSPPSLLGAFNDNYDTSLYSIRNRYYYISLTKKF